MPGTDVRSQRKLLVSSRKQLKVLSSPVRQVILNALIGDPQPATIREVADRVNRAADSLYYHFRALEKAGLVLDAGTKIENGKAVSQYLPAAREIRIKYDLGISGFKKLFIDIASAAMRLAGRDLQRGLNHPTVRFHNDARNLYMCRLEAWLTRDQLREVNQHIDRIVDIMNDNCAAQVGERCSVFLSMAPQQIRDTC